MPTTLRFMPAALRRAMTGLAALLAAGLAAGCTTSGDQPAGDEPTIQSEAPQHMVAAANPLAAEAGMRMLRQGGSAVDAAIATSMVLSLVEPQSSGIGGGAFLLHYGAGDRSVAAYDGRETAPSEAGEDLFLKSDGEPMGFWDAVVGGRSVGAPGLLRMLELAHQNHGRLPWADLFAPAIALAEEGFEISPRLHGLVAKDKYLMHYEAAETYFYDGAGAALAVGTKRKNQAFADTLRAVAEGGADAFYKGEIAVDIVNQVRSATGNPGLLSYRDMATYQAKKRKPVCAPYRQWQVCGMPPPTSGGVAVLQILSLLQPFDLSALDPASPEAIHLVAEASRLAFASTLR